MQLAAGRTCQGLDGLALLLVSACTTSCEHCSYNQLQCDYITAAWQLAVPHAGLTIRGPVHMQQVAISPASAINH